MPRLRFRVGTHKKVVIIQVQATTFSGGPEGSGAFGCRMQRMKVTNKIYRCVSGRCGAEASSEDELRALPHEPKNQL